MEDKIDVLIKAAGINGEPFWSGLFAKALAIVNMDSLICNVGAGGPRPGSWCFTPSISATLEEEEKVEVIGELKS